MPNLKQLLCLALAAFAIGTEGYVIAGILPLLAGDLHVSVSLAGQLISVFALTYAVASPILAVVTAATERRKLLMTSITLFGIFNLVAATAHSFTALMLARVGLALAAGAFMPAASAYAVAVVPQERRARALALIYMGLTLAMVIGVPVGVVAGEAFGWRFPFAAVAGMSFVAMIGLARNLQRIPGDTTVTLRQRLAIAREPAMLRALAVTAIVLAGVFSIYAYIAPFLQGAAGLTGGGIAAVLALFGVGSAAGNLLGGSLSDRAGPDRVVTSVLGLLAILFAGLGLAAEFLHGSAAAWVIVSLIGVWGLVGWCFPAAQQARIVALAPRFAPIALSLNASAIYLGVSAGAFLGSVVGRTGSFTHVPWAGSVCELAALVLAVAGAYVKPVTKNDHRIALEMAPGAAGEDISF